MPPLLIATAAAQAQGGIIDKIQSGLDDMARGMDYMGRRAEDLIGPGFGMGEDKKPAHTETRSFEERYPVGPAPSISVSNEFGEIRVNTWEERVVEVSATIAVGAESAAVAGEIAAAIELRVTHTEDALSVRTFLPDTRRDQGFVAIEVNYAITIPKGASLIADNFFGDTVVRGVGGQAAVEVQYGLVDLGAMDGPVHVRAHGEFPVKIRGLAQGGVFQLHGSQAEFSDVAGQLRVNNFRGAIRITDLRPDAALDIASDSGPIQVSLPPGAQPDFYATVLYGELESGFPVTRTTQGHKILARSPNPDSSQHIILNTVFGDIRIERGAPEGTPPPSMAGDVKPFNDVLTREEAGVEGIRLAVNAMVGDIRIEGVDEDVVRIAATRIAWVPAAFQAPTALEALQLQIQRDADRLSVNTVATADMATLECSSYRVDLAIQCSRAMPIEIHAQNGLTSLENLGGEIAVTQTAGGIAVLHNVGPLNLTNQNGAITVTDCSGPVQVSARYGAVTLTRVFAAITAHGVQGRTIIEGAQGPVTVRHSGGDVRILAIEGIGGDYDVLVENGKLSMLLGAEADAALTAKAINGAVRSAIPLTGTLTRETQEFHGRLKDGKYRVQLETQGGDIVLD